MRKSYNLGETQSSTGLNILFIKVEKGLLKRLRNPQADFQIFQSKHKHDLLLAQEEVFWKQRAKLFWLQEGDANTKLFHHKHLQEEGKILFISLKILEEDSVSGEKAFKILLLDIFQISLHQTVALIFKCLL